VTVLSRSRRSSRPRAEGLRAARSLGLASVILLALLLLLQHDFSARQIGAPTVAALTPGVVEAVEAGSPGARAGIEPGDRLLGWRLAEAGEATAGGGPALPGAGAFTDPWPVEPFAMEIPPRALVVLTGARDGIARDFPLPARTSRLGITLLPILDANDAAAWTGALNAPLTDTLDLGAEASTTVRGLVDRLSGQGDGIAAAWLRLQLADRLVRGRAFDRAAREYEALLALPVVSIDGARAATVYGRLSDLERRRARWDAALAALASAMAAEPPGARTLTRAGWLHRRAGVQRARGAQDEAAASAEEALAIRRELAPGSWDEAYALNELGSIALARRDLDEAQARHEAAYRIVAHPSADHVEAARIAFNLADLDWRRGRLAEAEQRLQPVVQITRATAPASVDHARNLNFLGILRNQSGDLVAGERLFAQALEVHVELDPGGVEEASTRNNLGIAAMQRGRFAEAERQFRQSLALKERLGALPLDRASTLGNLGLLSIERRDLTSARGYLERSLDLVRQVAPEAAEAANALNNLARVERLSGSLAPAERLARDSLAIRARTAPGSVNEAFSFAELGKIFEAGGRLDEAEDSHRRALAIRQQLLPDGTNTADSLDALGRLARRRGRHDEAAALHLQAGGIWQRMAPGHIYEALNLVERGRVEVARGRGDDALDLYARATGMLDAQTGNTGGSFETQADFRNAVTGYYAEHIGLLLERGRAGEAFHVSERARSRAFLALLAERDLVFSAEIPPALDARRRALTHEYGQLQAGLRALSPVRDAAAIETRVGRLREVRLELADANAEIARAAPQLAGIHAAAPLAAGAAQQLLGDATVAVSYVVGEGASHAFVLTRTSLDVFQIPLGRQALEERVQRFLRLTERPDEPVDALAALARELYRTLVTPAEAVLGRHQRLLVVPDGPLHALPFAALAREGAGADSERDWQYLVEWRPVHQVPSLTMLGHLQALPGGRLGPQATLLAAGGPRYASSAGVVAPQTALPPLPGSRREVELLGSLYGAQAATLLDEHASEEEVRQRLGDADIVHIAVHGIVNERFPLDSSLAFSTPADGEGGDNGQLQSWEILEQVRLRARLVVLSACDTAGAREGGGEGLLGLTRAFQFAGAPSVVASLWRVPDEVTPALMVEFHRQVRAGAPIDEALAVAQRAMLRDPRTAHPYNWAAFVLNGRSR
jgi:CHAT domain-containing protein/tetratricopeptide (TPR) repeat protein